MFDSPILRLDYASSPIKRHLLIVLGEQSVAGAPLYRRRNATGAAGGRKGLRDAPRRRCQKALRRARRRTGTDAREVPRRPAKSKKKMSHRHEVS